MNFTHTKRAIHDFRSRPMMAEVTKSLVVGSFDNLRKSIPVPNVFQRFPHLAEPFRKGLEAQSLLLMIDLSPFSSAVAKLDAAEIRDLLHLYYDSLVPIINQAGGIVEKYLGDAIIAVMGAPFNNNKEFRTWTGDVERAAELAMSMIEKVDETFRGELNAKVAIVMGDCYFGYLGHETHSELTMVGNPLTQLFRLEDHAPQMGVIMTNHLYGFAKPKLSRRVGSFRPQKPRSLELRGAGPVEVQEIVWNKTAVR